MNGPLGPDDEAVTMVQELADMLRSQERTMARDSYREGFNSAVGVIEFYASAMRWADTRARARIHLARIEADS